MVDLFMYRDPESKKVSDEAGEEEGAAEEEPEDHAVEDTMKQFDGEGEGSGEEEEGEEGEQWGGANATPGDFAA